MFYHTFQPTRLGLVWKWIFQTQSQSLQFYKDFVFHPHNEGFHQRIFMYKELTAALSSLLHLSFAVESRKL